MSKKFNIENIHKKTREFAISDNHRIGIRFVKKLLKNKELQNNKELVIDLAFLIYHEALKSYRKENSNILNRKAKKQLGKAAKLLEDVIYSEKKDINDNKLTNAKIFLAQIYAVIGNPKGILLAKENFKKNKNAVMANRLADVYMRFGDIKMANLWYKKYEKLAHHEKIPDYFINSDMAVFYKKIDKINLAKKYLENTLTKLPDSDIGRSIMSILRKRFDL